MNNKGFTLVELLAAVVIIALIMGIVLPSASRMSNENSNRIYQEYENMMEEYALISEYKGQSIIDLSNLDELSKVKNDCAGYVKLIKSNPIEYQAYVKCPKCGNSNYKTSGFDESKLTTQVNCENE